jgi:hypothetical protein
MSSRRSGNIRYLARSLSAARLSPEAIAPAPSSFSAGPNLLTAGRCKLPARTGRAARPDCIMCRLGHLSPHSFRQSADGGGERQDVTSRTSGGVSAALTPGGGVESVAVVFVDAG